MFAEPTASSFGRENLRQGCRTAFTSMSPILPHCLLGRVSRRSHRRTRTTDRIVPPAAKNTGKALAIWLFPWYSVCREVLPTNGCLPRRADYSVRLGEAWDGVIFLFRLLALGVVKFNHESNDGTEYQDETEQLRISNIHAHHLPVFSRKARKAGQTPVRRRWQHLPSAEAPEVL